MDIPSKGVTLIVMLLGVHGLAAQELRPDSSEIRAVGSAERSVRPDLATVTLRFTATDSTPLLAGQRLAARADSVRGALGALGIPRDSLVTGSRWHWWQGRLQTVPRTRCVPFPDREGCSQVRDSVYRAQETIQVRIRDMGRVGQVIDTALALEITNISNIAFSTTDTRAARVDAVAEATVRAREQAETMANALGMRLGRVISLGTQPDYSPSRLGVMEVTAFESPRGSDLGTEVTAPSITVRATVYGRWRLIEPDPGGH